MSIGKYAVKVALGDGFFRTIEVLAADEESAMRNAEHLLADTFDGPMAVSAERRVA